MCGRTACTLAPDDIVRACTFRTRQGKRRRPVWKDPPGGQQYYPSYNVAPAAHTPVLVSSRHYPGELESFSERVVQPMKWGLVPPWHKGDPYKLEYETNNCRAEGMLSKRTYKTPLEKGNRCVVLADGFFEWKRGPEGKQPFFIYFPQKSPPPSSDSKPDLSLATPHSVKPDPDVASSLKSQVKQEPVDVKPGTLKTDVKSFTSVKVEQEPEDVKPGTLKTDVKSFTSVKVKQEPEDVKSGTLKTDVKSLTSVKVEQEPVDVKPATLKTDVKSFTSVKVKQEPVDVNPDPQAADLRSSTNLQVKQEPVDIKPGTTAIPESDRKEEGGAASLWITDSRLTGSHSTKEDCSTERELEKESGRGQSASEDVAEGSDQTADDDDEEWQGKRLLTMAGVFDVWQPPDGSAPLYSYSVITVESSPAMTGIHHRMPALLSSEEEIRAWLDFAEVPLKQAVKVIRPTETISMHMVSPVVNNSRNKSPECVQLYNPKQVKKTASSNLMMNWLKKASPSALPDPPPQAKKQKLQ